MSEHLEIPAQNFRLHRKATLRFFLALFALLALLFSATAIWAIAQAFRPNQTTAWRLLLLATAAVLLFLPIRTAWVLLRRRWTKGQWMATVEERLRRRERYANSPFTANINRLVAVFWSLTFLLDATSIGIDLYKKTHNPHREIAFQVVTKGLMMAVCVWNLRVSSRLPPARGVNRTHNP